MAYPQTLTPHQLAQAPELAILALLEEALHFTILALVVQHPTLDLDHDGLEPNPCPTLRLAQRLVERLSNLRRLIQRYRDAVNHITHEIINDDVSF